MTRASGAWRGFRRLDGADRTLVLEAAFLVVAILIGLRIVRYSVLCRWLSGPASRRSRPRAPVARVAWAIATVTDRVPGTTCLVRALAAEAMLRRRGYQPEVRFGVRDPAVRRNQLDAHAWVECEGAVVVGATEDLTDYLVLSAPRRS
jgi:hypothetical protein